MTSSDLLKLEGSAVAKPTQAGSGYVMIIPSQEGLKKEESREGETLDEIPGANAELPCCPESIPLYKEIAPFTWT
ncbi:hypothetical protein FOVSG1_014552 [Fusarium oxysporum f. sp. vasinfectum]